MDDTARSRARRAGYVALAIAPIIAVGVGAYQLAGGSDDTLTTDTGNVSAGPQPSGIDPAIERGGTTEVLGLRFELPEGWIAAAPGSGATGAQLIGDDPEAAARFDRLLAEQPPETVLFGIDAEGDVDASLSVTTPSTDTFEGIPSLVESGREFFAEQPGYELTLDESRVLAGATGHVFGFELDDRGRRRVGFQFMVRVEQRLFLVTFVASDPATAGNLLDVADTLRPAAR